MWIGRSVRMKTAEGFVIEVTGTTANIKVGRHNECSNCGACPGDTSTIVTVRNEIGATVGQHVLYEVKETNTLLAAFIVFMFPLIGLVIGAGCGRLISNAVGGYQTVLEVVGALVVFLITILCIKLFDKSLNKNEKSRPSIVKIL